MAVTSGFFNSLGGDRKYNAEQMSELFNGIINDGVFSNIGTAFQVSVTTGKNITIGIGRAWFDGIWVDNDALLPMVVNDSEVLLDRIDAVVIEINRNEAIREGRIVFVRGVASGNPSRPAMTHDDEVNQYPLAYIYRRSGDSNVIQADITNMIGTSECPYITGVLETQNIDKIVAQWESQFNLWFDGLQDSLEGDVAANLTSHIIDMELRFNALAKDRAVYVPLQDANSREIQGSDATDIQGRTILGGNSDNGSSDIPPVPDAIEDVSKVGDIVTTTRTGLGANWLLCNGAALDREEYPELSAMVPISPRGPWGDIKLSIPSSYRYKKITCIKYYNEYYFALTNYYNGSNYVSSLWYTKDTKGPWTEIPFNQPDEYLYDIIYANGYYVIVGDSNTEDKSICYYRKNIASTGWSKSYITSSDRYYIRHVDYIDKTFIAYGGKLGNITGEYIYIASSPDKWTSVQISEAYSSTTINSVMKIGTMWYIIKPSEILLKDSLTGPYWPTWVYKNDTNIEGLNVGGVAFHDDSFIYAMCALSTDSNSAKSNTICMSVIPTDDYKNAYNIYLQPDGVVIPKIKGYVYANGYCVLTVETNPLTLLYCKDFLGPWETAIVKDQYGNPYTEGKFSDSSNEHYSGVIGADDSAFILGITHDGDSLPQLIFSQKSSFLLPEIALSDSAYSYIKVKR